MLNFTSHTKELTLPTGEGMTNKGNPTVRALLTLLLEEAGIRDIGSITADGLLMELPNQEFLNTDVEIVTQDGHEMAGRDDVTEQGIRQVTLESGGVIDTDDSKGGIETDVTPSTLRLIADDARRDTITD